MKRIVRRILHGKPSEEARLLAAANRFPRYTPHAFTYRDLKFEVGDFLSVAWQIMEVFSEQRLLFPSDKIDPLIIDCGANVGTTVLYFKKQFPDARIIAFEADPNVFVCLEKNLRQNDVSGVELHQKVVWTHHAGVDFGMEGADGGSVHQKENTKKLPSVRLKDILEQHQHIDLLKMDIEGAETDVILDCAEALQRVKYISVEYHSLTGEEQRLDVLLRVLHENGFRYSIQRIGTYHAQPFVKMEPGTMDLQLDIHAIRK